MTVTTLEGLKQLLFDLKSTREIAIDLEVCLITNQSMIIEGSSPPFLRHTPIGPFKASFV